MRMLVVETLAKIRRAFLVHGKAIKEMCREFRLSRKVVRKVIRSDETAFSRSRSSDRGSSCSIGCSQERVTLTRVFEDQRHWPARIAAAFLSDRFGEAALRHVNQADRRLWADRVLVAALPSQLCKARFLRIADLGGWCSMVGR